MSRSVQVGRRARSSVRLSLERLEDRSLLAASIGQIGINFVGGAPGSAGAAVLGMAGVVPQANWNNVANNGATSTGGAQTGAASFLIDDRGVPTTASVQWSANNSWIVAAAAPADPNAQLFKGYLDTTDTSITNVAIDNVPFDFYDVYVYFDGDAANGRSGIYTVDDGGAVQSQGPYVDRANWPIAAGGEAFVLADEPNEAGNYAIFRGQSGDSVTITARAANPAAFRAPINAIQIVGYPTPLVVNALGDTDDGDPNNGTMTLREAVNLSNSIPGPAEITFDLPSGFQRIFLSGSELLLGDDVSIAGPGIESLNIDANARSRVFHIAPDVHAALSGLWITGGGTGMGGMGGGVLNNAGSLTIDRCWIAYNQGDRGGGILNYGHSGRLAQLIVRESTISFNRATEGAGLDNFAIGGAASVNIIGSTVAYNDANYGGGIHNYSAPNGWVNLDITNSTISENTAREFGGGIFNWDGAVTLTATTVAKNDADMDRDGIGAGGGIFNRSSRGIVRIARSIVADNAASRDADLGKSQGAQYTSLGQNWFHRGVPGATIEYVYRGAPDEYDYYTVATVPTGITWEQANAAAVAGGGHLAAISSQEENQRIAALVLNQSRYWANGGCCSIGPWIGGRQSSVASEPAGGWTWVTNEPFTFANWHAGEPNDYDGVEDHLHFFSAPAGTFSGQWNDISGDSTSPVAYIVEYDALAYHYSDWIGYDPSLGPLSDNGGPTWTHQRQFRADDAAWPFLKTVEESNPWAWWPLDETAGASATEIVGNRHGAFSGGVRAGQLGVPGLRDANRGVELNGNGAQIVVPFDPALNGSSFGLEVWARLDATAGGPYPVVSNAHVDSSGNTSGFIVEMYGDGRIGFRQGTGTQSWLTGSSRINDERPGEWNHIGIGFSATGGPDANGIYVGRWLITANGNVIRDNYESSFKPNSVSPLRIGADWTGAASFFDGRIDEVVLYNGVRDAAHTAYWRPSEGTNGSLWQIVPTGSATQTSTWFDMPEMAASRAIDGDAHTFSHTALDDGNPEWRLDLGAPQPIGQIVLHNRRDCCASRLRDITVEILAPTGHVIFRSPLLNPENKLNSGSALDGPPALVVDVTSLVGGPVTGQTIVVRRTPDPDLSGSRGQGSQGEDYMLQLGEVQVFLTAPDVDQRGISRPRGSGFDIGSIESTHTTIVGRHVFYNNSHYDGNHPGANAADDAAISSNKRALRQPGQVASFENYTSFLHGINGIMIDVADLGNPPSSTDWDEYFAFSVRDNDNPVWRAAPPPSEVVTRPGAGVNGSDRITIIWPDGTIRNQWLHVTVLPGLSGLTQPDAFSFGNFVGDTGNLTSDWRVDFVDRTTIFLLAGLPAHVNSVFDINKDGVVGPSDADIIEQNYTALVGDLNFDDAVTLADLSIMQANLNSTITDPYRGDLNADQRVDRTDVALLLLGGPGHRFGSEAPLAMKRNRLGVLTVPVPSPAAPSPAPVMAAVADAALASAVPPRREPARLAATRSPAKIGAAAVDRAVADDVTATHPSQQPGKLRARRASLAERRSGVVRWE